MRIIRAPIVVVLVVAALAAVPASAAAGGGCPPAPSGWMQMTFEQAFAKELQDTVDFGYTVQFVLDLYGVPDVDALYEQIALPFFRSVDKSTGDGILCLREMPNEESAPWNSNYIDNRVAA